MEYFPIAIKILPNLLPAKRPELKQLWNFVELRVVLYAKFKF